MDLATCAGAHLDLRLSVLNRACTRAVEAQIAEAAKLDRPELADRCITDRQAVLLLQRVDDHARRRAPTCPHIGLTTPEREAEAHLRSVAAASSVQLPLDQLAERFELTELDQLALVAVAAPELDRAYERLYAYLADDFERRYPSVETLLDLTSGVDDRYARRRAFGTYGALRRCGLLEPVSTSPTGLRQELRLAPGLLEHLLGSRIDVGTIADLDTSGHGAALPSVDTPVVRRLAAAVVSGAVDLLNLWGARAGTLVETSAAIARFAGMPLHSLELGWPAVVSSIEPDVRRAFQAAAHAGAVLFVAIERVDATARAPLDDALAKLLTRSHQTVIVATEAPWRPGSVVAARAFADLQIEEPDATSRRARWQAVADLPAELARDLALRFPLTGEAVAAAASYARVATTLASGAAPSSPASVLEHACIAITAGGSRPYMTTITPQRRPEDLIVPASLHRQITEIATFTRALPTVTEHWGFGTLGAGRGLKVLFVGDPGTGKTLAAEVIASSLGMPLLLVDLAQIVSKWVGETAQHLDEVFQAAESCSTVLFFDEADSLFGRRGEVRHGTDRYANTEVSHLLQRFERHDGLVILASNLKENIDPAFTRRFHLVAQFPRPCRDDRLRLWRRAFPAQAPVSDDVDLTPLAELDMTGAGVVGAARMAALIAADEGATHIAMTHVVQGVARQFRSEGRVITPLELDRHGILLDCPA